MSERCTATSKRSGERCQRIIAPGAKVCATHGGKASQVSKAAEQRAVEQNALAQAQRMVQRAGVDLDPIEHLLDSLRLAYQLQQVWGIMVAAIDVKAEEEAEQEGFLRGELGYAQIERSGGMGTDVIVTPRDRLMAVNTKGEARVHPYMEEYQRAVERRAKFAKMCLDAGVAEAQVRIMERQVEMAQRVFEATLNDMGLKPDERQEARRTYARHLRLVA